MPAGRTAHCVDCFCIRVLCVFVSMFFFCVCSGCGFSLHSRAFYVNIGNNSPHIQTSVFTVFAILPPRICGGKTQTNRPNSIIILLFSQKTMHMVHNRIKCARAFSPNCHGHRRQQPKRQCDRVVATPPPPPPLTPLRVAADPPVVVGHGRAIAEIPYANRATCIYTTLKRTPVCVCVALWEFYLNIVMLAIGLGGRVMPDGSRTATTANLCRQRRRCISVNGVRYRFCGLLFRNSVCNLRTLRDDKRC